MNNTQGIGGLPLLNTQLNLTERPSRTAGRALHVQAASSDQAHVSEAGNLLSRALGLSDVRSQKVATISAAIADGSYAVPAAAVADKLIDHMLE